MTKTLCLFAVVCLLASISEAQSPVAGAGNSGGGLGISTVALAPTNKPPGTLNVMTDGNATNDCVAGGGANLVLCRWSGSSWGQFAGGTAAAGGANTQLQWNNASAIAGIAQWTTNGTTTITGSATAVFDMSASSVTAGLKLPAGVGAAPTTDGIASFNTTSHLPVWGSNAATATIPQNTTGTASQWFSAYNVATGAFTKSQPACADLSNASASCATDATNATNIGSGTLAAARMNPTVNAHTFLGNNTGLAAAASFLQLACADLSNGSTGCSMSTTAAGDISGTLPTATVVKINGNSVPSGAVADQALIGTAANTLGLTTLPNCTGGACALSYATSTHSYSALSSILTGTLTSTRMPFSNGTNSLTDSANLLYAAGSGFTQTQGANNTDAYLLKRNTDTSPTGNFLHFQDAAGVTDLFKVDVLGNATASSWSTNNAAGNAGMLSLVQGTAPSAVANAINFLAPASVTTYTLTWPAAIGAGLFRTSSGGAVAFSELSGDATTSASNVVTVAKVNGVSYAAAPSTDTTPIITAANTATYTAIPTCAADATHAEQYNTSTHTWACAAITATASPSAPPTSVQFNNGGALGGSANLEWVSPVLTIGATGVTGQLSIAGSTSGATAIQSNAVGTGTLTLPAATDTLVGKATTDIFTNKTINASNNTLSNITGAMMTNATVTATQLAAQYSKGSCSVGWGGTGAANAMASGDDAVTNNACYNDSGVTRTITAVKCRSDNAANTTVLTPTFGSAGTGTAILTGTVTCGNSYAYSATGTLANTAWTTGTGIDPGMSTVGNATSIAMIVEYTY